MIEDPPEEDWDDFYDAYEVEPHGWALAGAGAGAAFVVCMLALAAWMALN